MRTGDRAQALRALVPIAAGHAASIAAVASAVLIGVSLDRRALQAAAVALLVLVVIVHWKSRARPRAKTPSGHAGLALWSFVMSTGHGAGLMLVPSLIPLCSGSSAPLATASASPLALALAAVAVHTAAMLAVTGTIAAGAFRGFVAAQRRMIIRASNGSVHTSRP